MDYDKSFKQMKNDLCLIELSEIELSDHLTGYK